KIWRKYGVDKVSSVVKGAYILRFYAIENIDKVIREYRLFFYYKTMVIKPWTVDMDFVQLNLDFKYWGIKCLELTVASIGNLIKVDQATINLDKLMFARYLIEVRLRVVVEVKYEWKPCLCYKCKKLGHKEEDCRGKERKKIWRLKIQPSNGAQRKTKAEDSVMRVNLKLMMSV
ncbi:Gag polyprotein, partial [Bienertia sinuspersici]